MTRRPGLASRQAWTVSRLTWVPLQVELHQRILREERDLEAFVGDLGPRQPQLGQSGKVFEGLQPGVRHLRAVEVELLQSFIS